MNEDKIRTRQQFEEVVSAEIPGRQDPLRELLRTLMVHDLCQTDNSISPCMSKGQFQKLFRKENAKNMFILFVKDVIMDKVYKQEIIMQLRSTFQLL